MARYRFLVWEAVHQWPIWQGAMLTGAWLVTLALVSIGLAGCVFPALPGHIMIFGAAVWHRIIFGPESGIQWWTFVILGGLLVVSQVFELIAGAAGSKWFGGTKWGVWGAFLGGIVGLFFLPFGLILGPMIGAMVGEALIARQKIKPTIVSGVGSAIGTTASLIVKVGIGLLMTAWLFIDILAFN